LLERDGDTDAETRYKNLVEERQRRADAVILMNPKQYCIRAGDKAIIIADDMKSAQHVEQWDGTAVSAKAQELISITSTDKKTFRLLNNGLGPRLTDTQPVRVVAFV
jgi:predicted HAD superfamily phosphohydrolase